MQSWQACAQWICVLTHWESSLRTTTSRNPCKKTSQKTARAPWVLWMHQHSWPVEAQMATHFIHPCRGWLWHKICWHRACQPPNGMHKNEIQTRQRIVRHLYCGVKLEWDYNVRRLDISMVGYIQKQLLKCKHIVAPHPQHCPYSPEPKQIGSRPNLPSHLTQCANSAMPK